MREDLQLGTYLYRNTRCAVSTPRVHMHKKVRRPRGRRPRGQYGGSVGWKAWAGFEGTAVARDGRHELCGKVSVVGVYYLTDYTG